MSNKQPHDDSKSPSLLREAITHLGIALVAGGGTAGVYKLIDFIGTGNGAIHSILIILDIMFAATCLTELITSVLKGLLSILFSLDQLTATLNQSTFWKSLKDFLKKKPDRSQATPLILGMIIGFLIAVYLLLILAFSPASTIVLVGAGVILALTLIFLARSFLSGGFLGTLSSSGGFCLVFLVIIAMFLAFVGTTNLILRLSGNEQLFKNLMNLIFHIKS